MTIQQAFHAETMGLTALDLLMQGVSVIPVTGKRPAIASWQQYTKRAMQPNHFARLWSKNDNITGIAVIGGKVSGNLVVIDLDGLDAVRTFRNRFPDLTKTLTVASGSRAGQHLYIRTTHPTPAKRLKGYELRSEGCYTLCPPSVHPDTGNCYKVVNDAPVLVLDNLSPVLAWMDKQRAPSMDIARNTPAPTGHGSHNPAWVNAAVQTELNNLRRATAGNMNTVLNAVSYRLARICANPYSGLSVVKTQADILDAARAYIAKDGIRAATKTMESGWQAGYQKPVHIPEARHGRHS